MQQEELFVAVEMLSEVALINQALEVGQVHQFGSLLTSPSAGLSDVDPTLFHRYALNKMGLVFFSYNLCHAACFL